MASIFTNASTARTNTRNNSIIHGEVRAIESAENGAKCLRINPGNIGDKKKIHDVLKAAKDNDCSIRIGVNAGSLEKNLLEKYAEPCPEALVESALDNARLLEKHNFENYKMNFDKCFKEDLTSIQNLLFAINKKYLSEELKIDSSTKAEGNGSEIPTNPFEIVEMIRRYNSMNDATNPSDAIDDALDSFNSLEKK